MTGDVGPVQVAGQQAQYVELALAQRVDQGVARLAGGVGRRGLRARPLRRLDERRAGKPSRDGCGRASRAASPSGRPRRRRPGSSRRARRASGRARVVATSCWASAWRTRISMTVPIRPPPSAAASRRSRRASASASRLRLHGVLGEQDPRQGHVLVLVQVATARRRRTGPACRAHVERLGDVAVRRQHPRADGGHRLHVGRVVADVHALGLLEELRAPSPSRPRPRAAGPSRRASGTGSGPAPPTRRARRRGADGRPPRPGRCAPRPPGSVRPACPRCPAGRVPRARRARGRARRCAGPRRDDRGSARGRRA